jgi:hypothetical protein
MAAARHAPAYRFPALLMAGVFGLAHAAAPPAAPVASYSSAPAATHADLVGQISCSLQSALSPSPAYYLIAVVKHHGDLACDGQCETLSILHTYAARKPDGTAFPARILIVRPRTKLAHGMPAIDTGIAVIVPEGRRSTPQSAQPFRPDAAGVLPAPAPDERLPPPLYTEQSAPDATADDAANADSGDSERYVVRSEAAPADADKQALYAQGVQRAFATPRGADCQHVLEMSRAATPARPPEP